MCLSKKGDNLTYGTIVTLIVVLVVAAIIFLWITKGGSEVQEKLSDDKCTASIQGAASSKRFPSLSGVGRPTVKLDCPRKELTITKSDIAAGNKIDQEKAQQIIADAMLSCWKKVGSGEIDPFANWDNEKTSYCLICDELVFDDNLKEFINSAKTKEELFEKSIHNPLPFILAKSPINEDKTYYELLYKIPRGSKNYPTKAQLDELNKPEARSIVAPGSVVLLQMHKLEAKSSVTYYAGAALIGTAALGAIVLTGGLAAIPMVGLSSGLLIAGAGGAAALASTIGATAIFAITGSPFSDCKECNGIGGIYLVPAEQSFSEKIKLKDANNQEYEATLCNQVIN